MTFFQKVQYEKERGEGENNFTVEKSDKTSAKWSKSMSVMIAMLSNKTKKMGVIWCQKIYDGILAV